MANDSGGAPSGQALAVPVEPVARLDPSGFDPSRSALEEAVYAVRNAAGVSEWHRCHSSRPFDYEDFCVWVDHWVLMHPVVTQIAALQDRDVLLRLDGGGVDIDALTGCADDQVWADVPVEALRNAIATEAGTAETENTGSVHEGAGLQGIAQPQSVSGLSHTGVDRG